jgi:hypothetical protein
MTVILVFEIGCVRECVAVVCGMLAHRYLIKIIAILKILCVCVYVTMDRKTSNKGNLRAHLLYELTDTR